MRYFVTTATPPFALLSVTREKLEAASGSGTGVLAPLLRLVCADMFSGEGIGDAGQPALYRHHYSISKQSGVASRIPLPCLDLLDERVRGEEGVVLFRELLDEVLVLVELLQVLHRHAVEADLLSLLVVCNHTTTRKNKQGKTKNGDQASTARNTRDWK